MLVVPAGGYSPSLTARCSWLRNSLHPCSVLAFFGGEEDLDEDALNCRSSSSSSAVTVSVVGGVEVVVNVGAASYAVGGWDS